MNLNLTWTLKKPLNVSTNSFTEEVGRDYLEV